jgi:hypothetical protein
MRSTSKDDIKFKIKKKWQEKLPEIEKAYDLKKALNSIKKEINESVDTSLTRTGFSFKHTSSVKTVVERSLDQMVEEMLQEIEPEDKVGGI